MAHKILNRDSEHFSRIKVQGVGDGYFLFRHAVFSEIWEKNILDAKNN